MFKRRLLNIFLIAILFGISFYCFLYGYQYFNLRAYHYDEGAVAYGAAFLLDGGLLYRDFEVHEFPGQYYLLAAIFKIFGANINVQRLFGITILSLLAISICLLVRKLSSKTNAFLAFFLSLSWLRMHMVYARAVQTASLFSILSLFPVINFIYSGKNKWLFISGILVGITTLFRQDFGFYTFSAVFSVVFLKQLIPFTNKHWKEYLKLISAKESLFLAGICLGIFPVFIYFIKNSTFKDLILDTVIFPLTILIKEGMHAPVSSIENSICYIPLIIFLLTTFKILISISDTKKIDRNLCLLLVLLLGIGFFNYFRLYRCVSHLLYTMIPAIILFVLLCDDFLKRNTAKTALVYRNFMRLSIFLVTAGVFFYSIKALIHQVSFAEKDKLDVVRAYNCYDGSELAQSQVNAIKYIQKNTKSNEKIFVGNTRHDKILVGDTMFYFLSERYSATKYCQLDFGVSKKEIQKEIIADIRKNKPAYIILCSVFSNTVGLYQSVPEDGAKDLDNFILDNYKVEETFGSYVILRRITFL